VEIDVLIMNMSNKEIVRRFSDEVWGRGDLTVADEILAVNLIEHNPLPGQAAGRDGHKQIVGLFRSAFPDLRVTTEDLVEDGDRVALRWKAEGTHHGDLMGLSPTGKRVLLTGIEILRIANGEIVERWAEDNGQTVLAQLRS
jgi:predicted ester cyclase